MAHVLVRRLWEGELIPLLLARLGEAHAATLARDIAHHSGQRRGDIQDGDICIEIDAGPESLPRDPVIFPVGLAGAPLVAIGVYSELLRQLLSDTTLEARAGASAALVQAVGD